MLRSERARSIGSERVGEWVENTGGLVLEVLEVLSARVEGEMVVVTEMEASRTSGPFSPLVLCA